eukprot:6420204-Amphidinium_carterae.2
MEGMCQKHFQHRVPREENREDHCKISSHLYDQHKRLRMEFDVLEELRLLWTHHCAHVEAGLNMACAYDCSTQERLTCTKVTLLLGYCFGILALSGW